MDGDNPQQSPVPPGQWQFHPGDTTAPADPAPQANPDLQNMGQSPMLHQDAYAPAAADQPQTQPTSAVTWTASEFIAHQKSFGWYALLTLTAIVLAAVVFLITRDKVSTVLIIFLSIIFAVYAARKPRTLEYRLDASGLTIAQKFYAYGQFRSFAAVTEDAFTGVVFMPLKRFMPPITVYYDPKDSQRIAGILTDRLPMETHKLDPVDQFLRRIRF